MMTTTESMPEEEETTTADSMMNTFHALEFYKNQIPECLFELVQIDMAEDDLNERWGKSFNQSFMMAEEHRKEIIMEYKYSTAPENGRENKYQIDLNNNLVNHYYSNKLIYISISGFGQTRFGKAGWRTTSEGEI
jgi:hypothetical protein